MLVLRARGAAPVQLPGSRCLGKALGKAPRKGNLPHSCLEWLGDQVRNGKAEREKLDSKSQGQG